MRNLPMGGFLNHFDSLAGKLIAAVGMLLFLGVLIYGFIFFRYQERAMTKHIEAQARLSTDLVRRGVDYGMMTANRILIQQAIDTMGMSEELKGIRIINTSGQISYSTDRSELGKFVSDNSKARAALSSMGKSTTSTSINADKSGFQFITPILNEPGCYTAKCHVHKPDDAVLGLLQTDFGTEEIAVARQRMFVSTIIMGAIFVLTISMLLFFIIYRFVLKPVATLEEGMKRLAEGEMDHEIEIKTQDEMGHLADTFNQMMGDINRYRQRLENWAQELQNDVDEKSDEILLAHEQLIDAEKLASLGRLSAGVAHELNSPLTGIMTFAHLIKERIPEDKTEDRGDIDVIIQQTEKCSKIIKGLLGFARKGTTSEITRSDINAVIENSVSIVTQQSMFHDINVSLDLMPNLPEVMIDTSQVQQVIINLMSNATDAMNGKGNISIGTHATNIGPESYIEMTVTDNGPGIPPDQLSKIFEPFFTTKPVGKGTGLGLPVSYGIIKRFGGEIIVSSKPGKETRFTIKLPVNPPESIKQTPQAAE